MAEAAVRPAPAPVTDGVTRYASVKVMAEWFAAARAGESMIYATGPALDPREPADQLAKRWIREGKVAPKQKRAAGGRGFEYLLERTRGGSAVALRQAQGERSAVVAPDPDSVEGRIYALLRRWANLDQPCRSHEDIADLLGLSRDTVASRTRALRERGLIRVDWPARSGPRVVTIVATGRSTASGHLTGPQESQP